MVRIPKKKQNENKLIAGGMAFVMAFALAGCGSNTNDEDTKECEGETEYKKISEDEYENDDKESEYEDVCFICRRPESKAGRMFRIDPANLLERNLTPKATIFRISLPQRKSVTCFLDTLALSVSLPLVV